MKFGRIFSVNKNHSIDFFVTKDFLSPFNLDSIENIDYFNNIEKVFSSIGLTISDAVMNFFNSGGVQNKDV